MCHAPFISDYSHASKCLLMNTRNIALERYCIQEYYKCGKLYACNKNSTGLVLCCSIDGLYKEVQGLL